MKHLITISLIVTLFSCTQNEVTKESSSVTPNNNEIEAVNSQHGIVKEVEQTSSYTYLKIEENNTEKWVAITKTEYTIEEDFYFIEPHVMTNFKSKELNKTFDQILFIQHSQKTSFSTLDNKKNAPKPNKKNPQTKVENISITPREGGITISEIYKQSKELNGQKLTITGQVVKVNLGIMGRNWIHLQDGTEHDGNFDLLITSDQEAKLDEIITMDGVLALDQEFGGGIYSYKVLLENGIIIK